MKKIVIFAVVLILLEIFVVETIQRKHTGSKPLLRGRRDTDSNETKSNGRDDQDGDLEDEDVEVEQEEAGADERKKRDASISASASIEVKSTTDQIFSTVITGDGYEIETYRKNNLNQHIAFSSIRLNNQPNQILTTTVAPNDEDESSEESSSESERSSSSESYNDDSS